MSFDISKIDTQDVVNANKMLRSAHFRYLLTTFVLIRNIFAVRNSEYNIPLLMQVAHQEGRFYAITNSVTYWYKYSAIKQIEYMFK